MSDTHGDAARRRRNKIQRQLDEALEASFPASDPVAIVTSHEEEDWGADAADAVPPESAPPADSSAPAGNAPAGIPSKRR